MSLAPLHDGRLAERWPVMLPALIRRGQERCDAVVTDLTEIGCRVETDILLSEGAYLMLVFSGLSALDASVVWTQGNEAGLAFQPALHPAVLDHIVRAHPPVADQAEG